MSTRIRPETLTDFRRLGKDKLRRAGMSAAEAKALHDKRVKARRNDRYMKLQPRFMGLLKHVIPLGGHNKMVLEYTRAKNWMPSVAITESSREDKISNGRYSGRCKYIHYTYQRLIESWGVVTRGTLYAKIDTDNGLRSIMLRPWRGWHWETDANGVKLVDSNGRRDYHPTAIELLACSMSQFAAKARENHALRVKQQRESKLELRLVRKAEREGCRVCVKDSLRAGNCYAGTASWAVRHGLDTQQHYKPTQVLALANGDTSRVNIVIGVALRRHRQELRQGFCNITDHKTD